MGVEKELDGLLRQMRVLTTSRDGYIYGETLTRYDARGQTLVISTWRSVKDWEDWAKSDERKEVQRRIDMLLGTTTEYEIYTY